MPTSGLKPTMLLAAVSPHHVRVEREEKHPTTASSPSSTPWVWPMSPPQLVKDRIGCSTCSLCVVWYGMLIWQVLQAVHFFYVSILHLAVSLICTGKQLNHSEPKFVKLSAPMVSRQCDDVIIVCSLQSLLSLGCLWAFTASKIFQVYMMFYLSLLLCIYSKHMPSSFRLSQYFSSGFLNNFLAKVLCTCSNSAISLTFLVCLHVTWELSNEWSQIVYANKKGPLYT